MHTKADVKWREGEFKEPKDESDVAIDATVHSESIQLGLSTPELQINPDYVPRKRTSPSSSEVEQRRKEDVPVGASPWAQEVASRSLEEALTTEYIKEQGGDAPLSENTITLRALYIRFVKDRGVQGASQLLGVSKENILKVIEPM